jgi:DNA-binding Xre family transcriptional regulator
MNVKLRNRLEVLMKDSGVKSFEEMAQRLSENQGVSITRTSVSRKFRDEDVSLTLSLIEAICNELQCLPADLFETDVSDVSEAFVEDLRSRLQPFRYGTLRMGKPSERPETVTSADQTDPKSKRKPVTKAPSRRGEDAVASEDLDDITGPTVTHLHVDKLKPKP